MLRNQSLRKNLLFLVVIVAIGGCSLSSESLSLKSGWSNAEVKSSAEKCPESELFCCKKVNERSARTRPVI